jgi:long-chain acyl-CoA synthetase
MLILSFKGLVTAAQKLNRKGIVKKYQKEINQAYGSPS